jgi:hypothetical protein
MRIEIIKGSGKKYGLRDVIKAWLMAPTATPPANVSALFWLSLQPDHEIYLALINSQGCNM